MHPSDHEQREMDAASGLALDRQAEAKARAPIPNAPELSSVNGAHTPGPWTVDRAFGPYRSDKEDNDLPGAEISVPYPENLDGRHHSAIQVWGNEASANARLVVAAPDYFAAAGPLVALIEGFSGPDHDTFSATAGELRALAKAHRLATTGERP